MRPGAVGMGYMKSKIFKGILLSYACMICLFLSAYVAVALGESLTVHRERVSRDYQLKAREFRSAMDLQIIDAKNAVTGVNNSESVRRLYTSAVTLRGTPEPYLVYQITRELTAIKTSTRNLRLYNIFLFLDNYDKVYSSTKISQLDAEYGKRLADGPDLRLSTVKDLLKLDDANGLAFLKEYVIYLDDYTSSGSRKGSVLVLFDKASTLKYVRDRVGPSVGFSVRYRDRVSFSEGRADGERFAERSSVNDDVSYEIVADPSIYRFVVTAAGWNMILIGIGTCTLLAALAYAFACKYYRPYDNISRMISPDRRLQFENVEHLVVGIQSIIGERNGYRERMTVIAPYARQGMIHTMIAGDGDLARLSVFESGEYIALQRGFFALAVINVAYAGSEPPGKERLRRIAAAIEDAAKSFSTDDRAVDFYCEDTSNLFLIVSGEAEEGLDDLFYAIREELARRMSAERCVVTMGVSGIKNGIDQVSEAYENATKALGGMITGGRDSVYFYDRKDKDGNQGYYFPKDTDVRIARALKDLDADAIADCLGEIYERNVRRYDLTPETTGLLLDELHIAATKSIREWNQINGERVTVEKVRAATTLEESFDYYRSAFRALVDRADPAADQGDDPRDAEIVSFIDARFTDPAMSLQLISDAFAVGNKRILAACKRRTGVTYHRYLQDKRVAMASELLKTSEYPLERIGDMCGYASLLTFRRNFSAITGLNPSEYRSRER